MKIDPFCLLYLCRNTAGVAKNADEIALLKKMFADLDARGQEDSKRVSENNVNIENLNMNISLQNRTIQGLIEDRKSTFRNFSAG